MIVKLHSQRLQTVDEIRAFLSGSTTFDFELHSREEADRWIQDTLRQFGYLRTAGWSRLTWRRSVVCPAPRSLG